MARTNLHELASRLLAALAESATDGRFEGKLRAIATAAGLNPVRSAEAIRLLETLGRIEVLQRGRRGRDTIVSIASTAPVTLADLPKGQVRAAAGPAGLSYEDIGRSVVERLLELARDDGLRAAQVEAFASEAAAARGRIAELEARLEAAVQNERNLSVKAQAAEEALGRAEENLRRALNGAPRGHGDRRLPPQSSGGRARDTVPDDEARAVLDILRSGRQ